MNTSRYDKNAKERVPLAFDIFLVILICSVIALLAINYVNTTREIASLDNEIARLEKNNEKTRSLIANQIKEREALKNERIILFAKHKHMITPMPGQVCNINSHTPSNTVIANTAPLHSKPLKTASAPVLNKQFP